MPLDLVLSEVRALVARLAPAGTPVPFLDDHLLVADLGFDSVLIAELVLSCEERFAVCIPLETLLAGDPSTRTLAEAISLAR